MKNVPSIFRLKKKHTSLSDNDYNQVDALDVIREQSISSAMISAFMALVIMNILWAFISMIFDRFFPWFSLLQGIIIGISVKKFGRGIDWRFPIIASTFAIIAAITGNFLSALNLTGREFYTGALPLIIEISWYTVKTFVIKEFGVVGTIYALASAGIAAFYSNRILDRYQSLALHKFYTTKK
jgi:hypothetical protein